MKEFIDFGKIRSLKDGEDLLKDFKSILATEKIDGVASAMCQDAQGNFWAQSHNCIIGEDERVKENHGFCQWATTQKDHLREVYPDLEIAVFGEWYGSGILNRIQYCEDSKKFIVWAVRIHGFWLSRDNVEDVANHLGYDVVPILYEGPFDKEIVRPFTTCDSVVAKNNGITMPQKVEGVVISTRNVYFDSQGNKIVVKFKNPSFSESKSEKEGKQSVEIAGLKEWAEEWTTDERLTHVLGHLGDNPNIGAIMKEMVSDVQSECGDSWKLINSEWKACAKSITGITRKLLTERGMI